MDQVVIVQVSGDYPGILGLFEKAVVEHSYGELNMDVVREKIEIGEMLVWIVLVNGSPRAAMATEVVRYPTGLRSLRVTLLGGKDMDVWKSYAAKRLEMEAIYRHCRRLEVVGRKGFERALAPLGFKPVYTVLLKEINHGEDSGQS